MTTTLAPADRSDCVVTAQGDGEHFLFHCGEQFLWEPVPAGTRREQLRPGQVVQVDIALGPSATLFRAGETLRLVARTAKTIVSR